MMLTATTLETGTFGITSETLPRVFLGESAIYAIAHWAPPTKRSSTEVESNISVELANALNIEERVGVKERRIVDPDMSITDMALQAINKLLDNRTFDGEHIDLNEVDLLIYFGVAREAAEPATATFIQDQLGLEKTIAFDVSDACIGFIDAWCIADAMIASGRIRKALLVSAERISCISDSAVKEINRGESPLLHYAALSLGDGAVAVLVGDKNTTKKRVELVAGVRETYGRYSDLCILPALDKPMLTKAGRLFNVALSKFSELIDAVMTECAWSIDEIDRYIAHQASLPSIKKGSDSVNVPFHKTYNTIEKFGNMASVSVPFSLSKLLSEQGPWKQRRLLLVGFGSGLGVGVFALESKVGIQQ